MTISASALLILASGPPLFGLGDVPDAAAIRKNVAFFESRWEHTCKNQPELVQVKRVNCRALSVHTIRSWKQWDIEGGARCSYSYAIPDAEGRRRWHRVTETFALRRFACGDEGQEADLMCSTWNVLTAEASLGAN